jgi:hypothetical protein
LIAVSDRRPTAVTLVDQEIVGPYPLTRGTGPRLFAGGDAEHTFELAACDNYDNGVVYLAYRALA